MPIYMFECKDCDHYWQFYRKVIGEVPEQDNCPKCGKPGVRAYKCEVAGLPPFKSYWTEAFPSKISRGLPVEVRNRQQERELCKKHGFERVK